MYVCVFMRKIFTYEYLSKNIVTTIEQCHIILKFIHCNNQIFSCIYIYIAQYDDTDNINRSTQDLIDLCSSNIHYNYMLCYCSTGSPKINI